MADKLTKEARSRLMGRVKGKDTRPEMIVRKTAHALGYRFRLHRKDLPGCPDLVFPRLSKVIFVHGCFWHRHGCSRTTMPKTRTEFWRSKFDANIARDRKQTSELAKLGWECLVVWECETKDQIQLRNTLSNFLNDNEKMYK